MLRSQRETVPGTLPRPGGSTDRGASKEPLSFSLIRGNVISRPDAGKTASLRSSSRVDGFGPLARAFLAGHAEQTKLLRNSRD